MIRINRIFWKTFLLIYLANMAIVGITSLAIYWSESNSSHKKQQTFVTKIVKLVIKEYEKGKAVNTEDFFSTTIAKNPHRQRSLLKQTIRIYDQEKEALIFHNRLIASSSVVTEQKILVTSKSGHRYLVHSSMKAPPKIILEKIKSFSLIQIIFICLISALASYLLSWSIVRPLKRLGSYSQRYQQTQERVNIEQSLLTRGDEIGDLSRDIQSLHQSIDEKIIKQKELLHDVSHELRAPLARLQATAGLIQQKNDDSHIQRIHTECDKINALIQSILNYSRIDQVPLTMVDVNLSALLTAEIVAVSYQFLGRKITTQNIEPLAVMNVDQELFIQAFGNILRNACIYTDAETSIEVSAEHKGGQTFISVLDHGLGIPEVEIAQVLKPFYRQGQNMHSSGHGLGLSIAMRAMERMGGGITLKNHQGGGLLVTLYL